MLGLGCWGRGTGTGVLGWGTGPGVLGMGVLGSEVLGTGCWAWGARDGGAGLRGAGDGGAGPGDLLGSQVSRGGNMLSFEALVVTLSAQPFLWVGQGSVCAPHCMRACSWSSEVPTHPVSAPSIYLPQPLPRSPGLPHN